jgi:predicted lipoprotein
MKLYNLISIIIAASLTWGCVNSKQEKEEEKKEEEENITNNEENQETQFDIKDLLVNSADNIIISQLEDLKNSSQGIEIAFSEFIVDPSPEKLVNLQSNYKSGYLNWQSCSFINFGSNSSDYFASILNTFPVQTDNINSFHNNPDDNLEWDKYFGARGYPGLDYVFFEGEEEDIINRLKGLGKEYSTKNIELIKSYSTNNYNFWKNNESNYYQEFTTDVTKTKTSPFTNLVNAFCKDLEVLKNEQLKAPGGQEFFTFPLPLESEALYSGYSLDLFKAHLSNLERIYKGEDLSGVNGIGFDDYLTFLGTKREDENLNELILSTFNKIEELVNSLNGSINDAAANQKDTVDELYRNVKALVGYTKTDMTYAFGVNITYADPQDGD